MPLVADPNYADVFVCFDVHNLVGRCENGPSGTMTNRCGYPANAIDIGLAKVRLAAEFAGLSHNLRVCLVFSAGENRSVRGSVYPQYKATRPVKERQTFIIAGTRDVRLDDGQIYTFDYERDDVRRLYERDLIAAGEVHNCVQREYNGVRDFMEVVATLPCLILHMPDNDGETDDALATFTHLARPKPCVVVSEDRDLWALMSSRVTVISKPEKAYGIPDMQARFGIAEPGKLPLAKALYGDDTDNIVKAVANVTDNSVGDLLRRCAPIDGERWFTPAFMREVAASVDSASGRQAQTLRNLLAAERDVLFLEKLARLRRVRLSYTLGVRDETAFDAHLQWYGVQQKREKLLVFARS